jgi:hypothetical protein
MTNFEITHLDRLINAQREYALAIKVMTSMWNIHRNEWNKFHVETEGHISWQEATNSERSWFFNKKLPRQFTSFKCNHDNTITITYRESDYSDRTLEFTFPEAYVNDITNEFFAEFKKYVAQIFQDARSRSLDRAHQCIARENETLEHEERKILARLKEKYETT